MSLKLFDRFILKSIVTNCQFLYFYTRTLTMSKQMVKNVSQSSAVNASRQNRLKLKGKSKFAPGIVKFQVLGSGANGAPRCLYLFTDHSR